MDGSPCRCSAKCPRGLTIEQFQAELTRRLKHYYFEPQISVSVTEFRSQPVSVLGAVGHPGVHQLQRRTNLAEMLSLVGGLRPDAGPVLKITRRVERGPIPLENAHLDETGRFSVAEVNVKDLMDASRPSENIEVRPNDVVSVPTSATVYVIGEVKRSGGFVLGSRPRLTVLEALALAEGLQPRAAAKNARILRSGSPDSTTRTEIPLNISKIMAGKQEDIALLPNDILYIPVSKAKSTAMRTLETALQIGTSLVIWRL